MKDPWKLGLAGAESDLGPVPQSLQGPGMPRNLAFAIMELVGLGCKITQQWAPVREGRRQIEAMGPSPSG